MTSLGPVPIISMELQSHHGEELGQACPARAPKAREAEPFNLSHCMDSLPRAEGSGGSLCSCALFHPRPGDPAVPSSRELGIWTGGTGRGTREPWREPGAEEIWRGWGGQEAASHSFTRTEKHKPICTDLKPTEGHLVGKRVGI